MRTELKSLLRSCAFSAAVLFTGASASANEYVLTVSPVENNIEKFQIQCVDIDKRCTDILSVVRDLSKKQVLLGTPLSGKVVVNLNTPEDRTSFSFEIGSFKFCYTFSSHGGVMKITGGKETDSLQIQNNVDSQTFEINAIKANMLSITRGSYKTEVISMSNCNANTVLLTDYVVYKRLLFKTGYGDYIHPAIDAYKELLLNANTVLPTDCGAYKRLLFKTSKGDDIHKVIDVYEERRWKTNEGDYIHKVTGMYKEPLLKTSGENYIHNLILNGAHIWNDGMMKVDGIFCNVDGSVEGYLPSVVWHSGNCSQNALILRDEDLVKDDSTPEKVDSTSKNCTFFSDTSDSRVKHKDSTLNLLVKHKDSFYELPKNGCYRFILLGKFRCSSEKEDRYCLLREEDFHCFAVERDSGRKERVARISEVFGTYLNTFEAPAEEGYNRGAFISLFKNVKSVNLQIGKEWNRVFYQPCELKCASMGHALVIIREDALHQEPQQETHQGEISPFFANEIKNKLMFFQ